MLKEAILQLDSKGMKFGHYKIVVMLQSHSMSLLRRLSTPVVDDDWIIS